jgi:hypothetical protein
VLKNALHTTQGSDNIDTVIIQLPQFAIVTLRCPPEWIAVRSLAWIGNIMYMYSGLLFEQLILLPVRPYSPSFVVSQGMSIFLEESVDSGNSPIPTVFEVLKSETPVLCVCLFSLHGIFRPDACRIEELGLPWLQVSI